MKALYDLKDKLQDELDEIARKPDMSAGDLETVHKLTDTIKNIDKICALEEGGYSQAGDWDVQGYGRGSSYARRRDSRGRYSRDGYGREGYSRDGGKERMMGYLEQAMESATTDRERSEIRRMLDTIRQD